MDTKLPPFIVRVVSFGASIMILSFDKVPSLLMKGLTVFQKDLLDAEPSLQKISVNLEYESSVL